MEALAPSSGMVPVSLEEAQGLFEMGVGVYTHSPYGPYKLYQLQVVLPAKQHQQYYILAEESGQ